MKGKVIAVGVGSFLVLGAANAAFGFMKPVGSLPESASYGTHSAGRPASNKELDGWIKEALVIMEREGIPGSYDGIHRNIIRESGGNPNICNDWDINAQNGIPSCGLLQVIPPTFKAHHVEGTKNDVLDPVANITAACHYAWKRYGSIDNVDGPY